MSSKAIDNLLSKVFEETTKEINISLEDASKQVNQILSEEEKEALKEIVKIRENFEREAQALERRIISSAEMEAKSKNLVLIEEAISRAFSEALNTIRDMKRDEKYEDTLRLLLEEAIDAVGQKEVIVQANEKDLPILKIILAKPFKGRKVKVILKDEPLNCSGGLVVTSKDGTITFSNTMEARLERMKPILKRKLIELVGRV
ncbi:MAG: V-type ATP synthase subunit E family protein [Nitrososphaerales archaeon]